MSGLIDSNSRFAVNPTNIRGIQRSKFDMSHTIKTTLNTGDLIPFDVMEVLPGDTFNVETNTLTRLQTLITPLMDDLYLDTYYFFVPNRLVWDHWKEFNGENTKSSWYPNTTYTVPKILVTPDELTNARNTIIDYMGFPVQALKSDSALINALPIRAYNLIWNEWFRDQNLQDPILVPTDDAEYKFDATDSKSGGTVLKANKYHDYFTSALPSPQKGPDVTLAMNGGNDLPVFPKFDNIPDSLMTDKLGVRYKVDGNLTSGQVRNVYITGGSDNNNAELKGYDTPAVSGQSRPFAITPSNLWAQTDGASVATINQLRLAFATQQLYELDARGGTRYVEILKAHFGVTSPDARQQRPELLAYNHTPININQVVQQSGTNTSTALGDVAGLSVTADSDNSFVKSFTEHGFIIGLACVRYKHSYQQGINRMWTRKTRFDYYWPVFANIGEQPILNSEIYLQGAPADYDVFGYQEAWAEYRYVPDRVSGEMRSGISKTLDYWHLADNYSSLPHLSSDWIQETAVPVNRAIAVEDKLVDQFFMDIYLKIEATRPMPMYSIPGLTRM